ncbi:MAG: hypothetical protein AB1938_15775 [Myxococcota bacterium]
MLALPALFVGFVLDDWVHRALLAGAFTHADPWDLFSFAPGDPERFRPSFELGPFPWFSLPELKLRFFRPLSTALVHLDAALFGDSAFLAHLHSLLWGLVLIAAAQRLYRRAIPGLAAAALLLFAVDRSHVMPLAWLANRNSLVATGLVAWGLVGHLAWRQDGKRWGLVLSVLSWSAALCAAEAALGALAYVPAYELLGHDDTRRARLKALIPVTLVGLSFIVVYRLTGSGAWGGATYIDPVQEPLVYLSNAPARLLAMVGAWTSALPADLWLVLPRARPLLIGLGVVGLVLWPVLWKWLRIDEDPDARAVTWLSFGAMLGVFPFLATFPTDRLMIGPSLGLAALVACVLRAAWRRKRWPVLIWLGLSLGLTVPSSWLLVPRMLGAWRDGVQTAALAPKGFDSWAGRRVVIIDCSDFAVGVYTVPALATLGEPLPAAWNLLSPAMAAHRLTRVDERIFTLEIIDGRILDTVFEQNARADRFPLRVGDVVKLKYLTVTVLSTDQDKPNRIEVALHDSPEAYTFVRWNGETVERVELPPPGQSLELPRAQATMERLFPPL